MRRILVAVDETQASREAARTAVEYAERLGARLTFLHVLPPRVSGDGGAGDAPEFEAFEHACEREAQRMVEEACQLTGACRPLAESSVRYGEPVEVLCLAAESEDVDLVITGTRERGPLARALLGSVAARLVSQCCKPVLVVPERHASNRTVAALSPGDAPPR